MNRRVVKRVVLSGGNRSVRAHWGIECAQGGDMTYLLCRGFPSIGRHQQIPEYAVTMQCKQCEKSLVKMMRTRSDRFILTRIGGEKHDRDREERFDFPAEDDEA